MINYGVVQRNPGVNLGRVIHANCIVEIVWKMIECSKTKSVVPFEGSGPSINMGQIIGVLIFSISDIHISWWKYYAWNLGLYKVWIW